MHILDIETLPLPDDQLANLKPVFEPPSNYKDPEKIKANLIDQEAKWKEQAALSALTGRVAIIGLLNPLGAFTSLVAHTHEEEADIIRAFWVEYGMGHVLGWNIKGFDLPFLIQRSWIHGIRVPDNVWDGRYFSAEFATDIMERWICFQPSLRSGSTLDAVVRACGLGAKQMKGSDFGKLWNESVHNAIDYCSMDCELTLRLAKRLGVL